MKKLIVYIILFIFCFSFADVYGLPLSYEDGKQQISDLCDVDVREVSWNILWKALKTDFGINHEDVDTISYHFYYDEGLILKLYTADDKDCYVYFMGYDGSIRYLKDYVEENKDEVKNTQDTIIKKNVANRKYIVYDKKGNIKFEWQAELDEEFDMVYIGNGYYAASEYINEDKYLVGKEFIHEEDKERLDGIENFGHTIIFDENGKEIYRGNGLMFQFISSFSTELKYITLEPFSNGMLFLSEWDRSGKRDDHSYLIQNGEFVAETSVAVKLSMHDYYDTVMMLDEKTIGIIHEGYIPGEPEPIVKIFDLELNLLAEMNSPIVDEMGYVCYSMVSNGYILIEDNEKITVIATGKALEKEKEHKEKEEEIGVYVDEKKIEFDVKPEMEADRVLVPMRGVFEALGAEVTWDEERNTAIAKKGADEIEITIGSNVMIKNGEEIELDVTAKMKEDRTLVPLRAVSEALGAKVEWEEVLERVYIYTDSSEEEAMASSFFVKKG